MQTNVLLSYETSSRIVTVDSILETSEIPRAHKCIKKILSEKQVLVSNTAYLTSSLKRASVCTLYFDSSSFSFSYQKYTTEEILGFVKVFNTFQQKYNTHFLTKQSISVFKKLNGQIQRGICPCFYLFERITEECFDQFQIKSVSYYQWQQI